MVKYVKKAKMIDDEKLFLGLPLAFAVKNHKFKCSHVFKIFPQVHTVSVT